MARFGFTTFGDPNVFHRLPADPPTPKAGQVQLRVLAVGLNPYDASLRRGEQAAVRPLKFPIVPGTDVVGTITALGADVTGFALGDVVLNYRPIGGYSEFVTASVGKLVANPANLAVATAAGLPQVSIAAVTILDQLALPAGATVAVAGASGGVGAVLVQLALAAKLRVLALASPNNLDYLHTLGATAVADYAHAAAFAGQADAAVNAVAGGADHGAAATTLKPGGLLITTGGTADPAPRADIQSTALTHLDAFAPAMTTALAAHVTLPIIARLPFSTAGVIAGHELLETHHAPGKIVLVAE
ncbi:alcohol dehydrogenase catalytic domain-containing protein [Lacticaseibacillus nasuensis]|uniref:NADPH quinone reductase n=2 Tax=Lacticaseibacillus TaxID=2759736 RepID=A0A0R1JSU9_9LACO|nr:alcohol dehydrogenase catalytic domain-containing protein [Lacticaseibacillus nasuensis]KRK74172.1 NADPH quinone reductase [Lacticaseibacillus nasuensis JCM 17158]